MILPSWVLKLIERLVPSSPSLVYHHTYPEYHFVNGTGNLPLKPEPDQNMKDTVVFLSVSFSINSFKQEMHKSLSQRKKNEKNIRYLIHSLWDRVFKGTVVNLTLSYLYGGSVEITLTVPLLMNGNLSVCQSPWGSWIFRHFEFISKVTLLIFIYNKDADI